MKCPWQNSDASSDARTSMSNNLNAHLDDLEDKPRTSIDNDYLNFLRLVTGKPAKHKPISINEPSSIKQEIDRPVMDPCPLDDGDDLSFSDSCEGQESEIRSVNDVQEDKEVDDEIQERSSRPDVAMDREYAILVANSHALECGVAGNDLLFDMNVEGDQDSSHLFAKPRSLEDGANVREISISLANEKNDVAVQGRSLDATKDMAAKNSSQNLAQEGSIEPWEDSE